MITDNELLEKERERKILSKQEQLNGKRVRARAGLPEESM